ncbi:argininosuccinate lyase [Moraxella catarrhalis]|uniref:argininosuccinate lyase n=1 Tax=Moraxella catarrhalis TaxID=480 RepID=UPI0001D26631|nr:argininosuccinate lyase [Moraxella catarrhalis]ADG60291.1 argininosuccinate lyase [Moraxella catarrhalis BBH18]AIK00604.1 argininosuccinate lyase [Moraxella catarrhalis]AIT42519.1 Argininosuccinate lyase [Moraxella catarrhalis]AVL50389.1 argininosuccinate lyase [Moraxella catarrhalis]EGE12090.1 argininosuccinate lyase [Moraxella catarrhalis 7169]
MSEQTSSMWGGRFSEATDSFVAEFTASVNFDKRMARQDIQGSIAHATMLGMCGIITQDESCQIINGLTQIQAEIDDGKFQWSVVLEDVHMNIESRLTTLIGDVGKKLHTGRSRNDQVATDIRLWLRDETDNILVLLAKLQSGLLDLAANHTKTIMPGFTHLQTAQPVSFGHHVMAWFEMLVRDSERFVDTRHRINQMPLGSAALAGTTYPIDRTITARLLGFEGICQNSLDAVSDRDFAIEFTANASILMMHLSRMSEELILWMSAQFGFIHIPDRFCTGSSIMPQKKNPDVPELVRGKAARVFGQLTTLLTLMKNQPLAYNKDNQEDKEPLFDCVDTLTGSLLAFADMLPNIIPNVDNMRAATMKGYATATDLADYLVKKGLPFRDAHEVVGKAVGLGVSKGVDLSELSLDELQSFSPLIECDVFDCLTLEGSLTARNHIGGTAPNQVLSAIKRGRERIINPKTA